MFNVERNGAVEVLTGDGPVTGESLDSLRTLWKIQVHGVPPRVVFDMSKVPLIDSRGLDWLCDTHDECSIRGGRLLLAAPTALCGEILHVTGVDRYCRIVADVQSGIGSFSL